MRFDLTGANIELGNFQRFDPAALPSRGQAVFHLNRLWHRGRPGNPMERSISVILCCTGKQLAPDCSCGAMAKRAAARAALLILKMRSCMLMGAVHLRFSR